jgi:MiaB-like tRNA modifying enzyme
MAMIFIKTYGCTLNQSDSQTMAYHLRDKLAPSIDEADIVIFNTCGVKGQTEHKIIKDIAAAVDTKKVIVAGCLPLINEDVLPTGICAVIGPDQVTHIREIVEAVEEGTFVRDIELATSTPHIRPQLRHGISAIIPISLGCMGACSYCATRFARGTLRSFDQDGIVSTIDSLLAEGHKEFLLTSQDTGCYGLDQDTSLPELLHAITQLDGDFRVRVGMMNPNHAHAMLDDLVDAFDDRRIYSFLHLPVQSGSDRVLEAMNRRYGSSAFYEVVDAFRQRFPDLYLATDIIVGFPGETEEDFQRSLDLVYRCSPDKVNITRYSSRPGTEAAKMAQFPDRIKKDRSRILSREVHKRSHAINMRYVGKNVRALIVEEGKKGRAVGRLDNYKPVICDGTIGTFANVTIRDATPTYLIA